eukprot:738309-Prorocentrum_minimum.AAC.7
MGESGEKWEKVGNWMYEVDTQGEKRGRVSGVLNECIIAVIGTGGPIIFEGRGGLNGRFAGGGVWIIKLALHLIIKELAQAAPKKK